MGSGGAGGGFSGAGHAGGGGGRPARLQAYGQLQGYEEDWMAKTKETIEKELKYRGVDPAIIAEVKDKIEEPSIAGPVIIGMLATALVLTLIFVAIWESTP
jgi:hypothetical protein